MLITLSYALGLAAIAVAGIAGFMMLSGVVGILTSDEGRVRSRVRSLGVEDIPSGVSSSLVVKIAAATASGWTARLTSQIGALVRILDRGGVAQDSTRISAGGFSGVVDPSDLIRVRAFVGLSLAAFLALMTAGNGLGVAILFGLVGLFLGTRLQSFSIARLAADRQRECLQDLPEMIDMISLGTRAGMSFDRALELYSERFDGPLSEEFGRALKTWQYGAASRDEALGTVSEALDVDAVTRFVAAVLQATRLGSPLSAII